MRCQEAEAWLVSAADPAVPARAVADHLTHCPTCRRKQGRLARLNAVLSLFQALGGGWYPAPPHVPDRTRHVADGGRTIDEVLLASPPGLGDYAKPVGANDGRTVDEVLLGPRRLARDVAEAR